MASTVTVRAPLAAAASGLARRVGERMYEAAPRPGFSSELFPRIGLSTRAPNTIGVGVSRQCNSGSRSVVSASIAVGSPIPDSNLSYFDKDGNMQTISTKELTKGKKVVLFAVPGAFTPTCSQKHVPGFIEKADELKSKGVDTIACVSVNDPFVMRAWGESIANSDKVLLLADGSGLFTKELGVELDLTDKGLGIRSRRYALLADDGVVKVLNLEEGGAFTISGPEEILKVL